MTSDAKSYLGIMVSSTFTDLKHHRQKVIDAISKNKFMPVVMEHSGAATSDVISKSLSMVAECSAYVLLISHRYGETPKSTANPDDLSITELEFNEAVKLSRPRLLFVMSDDHPTTKSQIETDPDKQAKLEAFKRRAKLADPGDTDSDLTQIYEEFSSADDLATKAALAIGQLVAHLTPHPAPPIAGGAIEPGITLPSIPRPNPPVLRAIPSYGASQRFVGRRAELETLDDWASRNDPNPILLFEAIGGTGKSMLTWHWLNAPHQGASGDWAGRFWYSFYEQGATLAEFCWEALSYLTGFPAETFRKMRGSELAERLLAALNARRWLLVLDGMERILVGYQRLDAPQLRDEKVDDIGDPIANRDPRLCIRPEDDDLLGRLAQVSGSKLLISSRLIPAVFINRGGTAIPGVRRELLKGLRPADALALFRAFGVEGPDSEIQDFLHAHCDGHPLTVGALAGLVNAYPRDRGNFVPWRDDPRHGAALNLAECNLVQKRNHILDAAIAALQVKTRELLQSLSILRGGADYDLLLAINPFLQPRPDPVGEPEHPEIIWRPIWDQTSDDWKQERLGEYNRNLGLYQNYIAEEAAWRADATVKSAPIRLNMALDDLEKRGLLQFDKFTRRYDLHPVVRGVASGRMKINEVEVSGTRLVDYCQAKSPNDWSGAQVLADVELGLQTVSALLRMNRFEDALWVYSGSLSQALICNLEADDQVLALMRGFFSDGWNLNPTLLDLKNQSYILNEVAIVTPESDKGRRGEFWQRAIKLVLLGNNYEEITTGIENLSTIFPLAIQYRFNKLTFALGCAIHDNDRTFIALLRRAWIYMHINDRSKFESILKNLKEQRPPSSRSLYRPGNLELIMVYASYMSGILDKKLLANSENVAKLGRNRNVQRKLLTIRGRWLLSCNKPHAAIGPLQTAVALARDVGRADSLAEAALALALLRHGKGDLEPDLARWDTFHDTAALYIAWFWHERGEREHALTYALRAYRDAHDPGEPYVYRWEADNARALLIELGTVPPEIPPYDPEADPPYPWEAEVHALIAKLEAENAAKEAAEDEEKSKDPPKPRRRKPKSHQ